MSSPSSAPAPITVCLIGCGAVSRLFYCPSLIELERHGFLRVIAVADPSEKARAELLSNFPTARSCPTHEAAFKGAQLAIIASPPSLHRAQAEAAFKAGLDVLCEKPLASTSADATAMADAAEHAGRLLAGGQYKRFFPAHRALKSIIEKRPFGPLKSFSIPEGGKFTWPAASDSFFRSEVTPGGVLLDIGVHVLDLVLWWLGEPKDFSYSDDRLDGLEANCILKASWADGVQGDIILSRDWKTANCYTFRFEHATVHCRVNASNQLELTFEGIPMTFVSELHEPSPDHPSAPTPLLESNPQAFILQLIDLCEAVRNRRPPFVPGRDAGRAVGWIEQCYAHREARVL